MWYVYILRTQAGSLYTGVTNNPARRLKAHQEGRGGRFTRGFGARELVYSVAVPSRSAALKREAEIKKWRREKKLALIAGEIV